MDAEQKDLLKKGLRLSTLGLELGVMLGLSVYAGLKLEEWFAIAPYGLIGSIVLGLTAMVWRLIKVVKRYAP